MRYDERVSRFNLNESVLERVYSRFVALDPGELKEKFVEEDQRLMVTGQWDYKNPELIPNQIKNAIEEVGIKNVLDEKESTWIQEILWLWYHHAISCALWRYGNKEAARIYSAKALELQSPDHPNQITRLLYLLVRDDFATAEKWSESITTGPEKATARHLLNLYRENKFFEPQI